MEWTCEKQRRGIWQDVESRDDLVAAIGAKTTKTTCCCNHAKCANFRGESWCKRFFVIGVDCEDRAGRTIDPSVGEILVRMSLASRSYQDSHFQLVDNRS